MLILREAEYDVDSHFCPSKFEASEVLAVRAVTMSWHRRDTFPPVPDLYRTVSYTSSENIQFEAN